MKVSKVIVIAVTFFCGCERHQIESADNDSPATPTVANNGDPIPSNFAVPESALRDSSLSQFAGGLDFKSKSFSKWLDDNGKFGELVALSDKRIFELAKDARSQRPITEGKNQVFDGYANPENRVCDLAYQLINKKYGEQSLGYRNNTQERDAIIESLIEVIEKSRN